MTKRFRFIPVLIFVLLLVSPLTLSAQSADPSAPADIVITDTVIATDIEPLGANLTTLTGGTNYATNNLFPGAGMEPAIIRYLVRVERSGPGWIEWDESLGGVHLWDQLATGFGDGATIRFYRLVNADGQPLAYGGGSEMQEASDADHVVFLGESTVPEGGWIAEGSEGAKNRVHLADASVELTYGDYAFITVKKFHIEPEEVHPRLLEWFSDSTGILAPWDENGASRIVPHESDLPAEFIDAGEGCAELTAGEGGAWFGQYLFHAYDDGEGQWYGQLEPGASYRAEVWLKQEGLADGKVQFFVGGAYAGTVPVPAWDVTGEWAHYTVDFTGPDYPQPDQWHGSLGLQVQSAGTVWADNFVVYRNDEAHDFRPFTPQHLAFDELMASMPQTGHKPAVRFYPMTYPTHSDMAHFLSDYPNSGMDAIYNVQPGVPMTAPHILEWGMATGDSPENRIVPIITLSEEYTEVEWLQLVEYLGASYDPVRDTPESKPWAYLRTQQRGMNTPWTDEFREIVLEFGNETWHNGAFGGWDGFSRPNWVWFGGREYGLFAHYFFVENVAAQAWWTENNLNDKITFALNAGYDAQADSYGELATQQIPELTTYLGHANYVGPKWETEEQGFSAFDDAGMQETLVGGYLTMLPLIEQVGETRDALVAAGTANYRPFAYEGGPSGYSLPGTTSDEQVAISELYGKSLGMGVSALDAWLFSSANGYGHQAYLGFASGDHWSSHTLPALGGFRRHTGWLALMMRNRYAPGTEMLETTFTTVPSYDRLGETIPLTSAYTIREPETNTLSVFVLSRKLNDSTPVTIHLPMNTCTTITRYALTAPDGSPADPRANNIDAENVVIASVSVPAEECADGVLTISPETGGVEGGMPPGTVYLYVFEGVE